MAYMLCTRNGGPAGFYRTSRTSAAMARRIPAVACRRSDTVQHEPPSYLARAPLVDVYASTQPKQAGEAVAALTGSAVAALTGSARTARRASR